MTVSIAFERYTAVHYPLDYNQVSNLKILISNILTDVNRAVEGNVMAS